MPKKRRVKIPEQDTIDLILKRLAGKTLEEIAAEYGVSKQVVQYHETKELTQELKLVVLRRAAEVAGEVLGQRALEKNGVALAKAERDDEDTDLSDLILAGTENGKNGDSPRGKRTGARSGGRANTGGHGARVLVRGSEQDLGGAEGFCYDSADERLLVANLGGGCGQRRGYRQGAHGSFQ